jgi:transcriptional regulator GlxA family with amidase domain
MATLPELRGVTCDDPAATIGVLVYRGVSSSEVDEPVTRLAERMRADVVFVGRHVGPLHAVEPSRPVVVDVAAADMGPVDVLVVPGGLGWKQVIDDDDVRAWLARAACNSRGILAMSTGSLLLGSVGRLDGREATGHWLASAELAAMGATVTGARTARDDSGRVVTASGALAAIQVIDDLADRAQWAEWVR